MKDINLFCFPFAGGNKYSYREYEKNAPAFMQVVAVEYPGRGARMKDAFITDMEALVNDLYQEIRSELGKKDYALYGHSMGGIVAFFLAKKIIAENHPAPLHLFITGTSGPSSILREQKKRHRMGKNEFIQEIKDLGGCPDEILQNNELLNFFEPILRADFEVSETFSYEQGEPISVPVTVITGTEEEMEAEEIFLWQKETKYKVDFRKMPGKHFFILDHAVEIISIIGAKLNKQYKTY